MMMLKMKVGLVTPVMRLTMNEEYLRAKFNLCLDQAEKNIKEEEIALAIKNLERANSAMARLFGLESEDESE
jgi:hypothetical protein